jgi:hypothetical protein
MPIAYDECGNWKFFCELHLGYGMRSVSRLPRNVIDTLFSSHQMARLVFERSACRERPYCIEKIGAGFAINLTA